MSEKTIIKKIWHLLIFAFLIFCLFLFKPREDVVFAAINESQCIQLFEKGKDFQLRLEESLIYRGTYTISNDTVFLFYEDQIDLSSKQHYRQVGALSDVLPLKLLINENASRIIASDGSSFSAQVYLDTRYSSPREVPEKMPLFKNQQAVISTIKTSR